MEDIQLKEENVVSNQHGNNYKVYKSRWNVLITVVLLTIANNMLWISFAPVSTVAADYYNVDPGRIDLMSSISFLIGMPVCLMSTYITDKWGLKAGVYIAMGSTFLGGLIRFLSTLPGLIDSSDEYMSNDEFRAWQYWFSIIGQAINGIGTPISVSLPTKVSQNWFPEKEVTIATGLLAISLPVGIAAGYGGTTIFVEEDKDVPLMNLVWFIPAAFTFFYMFYGVRTSNPPTPPSRSADLETDEHKEPYLQSMKKLVKNPQYIILWISLGGAVGFFNAFLTLLQQMMCSRGYDLGFSGLCGSLVLLTGGIGAIGGGFVVIKTGKLEETAKIMLAIAVWFGILMTELMRKSNVDAFLAISCAFFGIFAFGFYPLGLELSVEASYPVDEASGTALIFLSGQIQGAILIVISGFLAEEVDLPNDICPELGDGSYYTGKNHTKFLMLLAIYITFIGTIFILFFENKNKRKTANAIEDNSLEST